MYSGKMVIIGPHKQIEMFELLYIFAHSHVENLKMCIAIFAHFDIVHEVTSFLDFKTYMALHKFTWTKENKS